MVNVKQIIFFISVSLYSALILFLTSEVYLIGGSNVIEFVYSIAMSVKVVVILGLFAFGYISFFTKKINFFGKFMFALVFFLSFVSSQNVVYSGKNNTIEYYIYGFSVDKINLDPSDEENVVIDSTSPGLTRVSNGDMSLTYLSLFCPFCLDVSEMQKF